MTSKLDAPKRRRGEALALSSVQNWVGIAGRPVTVLFVLVAGYLASRVLTTAFLLGAYVMVTTVHWPVASVDGSTSFLGFLQSWDGAFYRQIALVGYPSHLPLDATGAVAKNAWAFLPLYPLIVRGAMAVTNLGFGVTGIMVAVLFGLGATIALHRVLIQRFGPDAALWGALFFCFGPLSFVLQVDYADSLFLFLMFCALAAMMSRRYLVMIPFGVAAAFAHPGALALSGALVVMAAIRLIRREPFPLREKLSAGAAAIVIGVAGVGWPIIAALATRTPSAYFDSELAWWGDFLGHTQFWPFTPWFLMAGRYVGAFGIMIVIAIFGSAAWLLASRRTRRALGTDILSYIASYSAYLAAVFLPQQSIMRMLLPLSPLLGAPALSRTPARRWTTLAVSVFLQAGAILLLWLIWPP